MVQGSMDIIYEAITHDIGAFNCADYNAALSFPSLYWRKSSLEDCTTHHLHSTYLRLIYPLFEHSLFSFIFLRSTRYHINHNKMSSKPLRIGVLLVDSVQLLDIAAVDLLYMTSPEYIADIGMPKPLQDLGRPCEIHYIALSGANSHSPLTSHMSIQLTDSLTDEAVAPGNLDILCIPGPPPMRMPPAQAYLDFVRQHDAIGTTIMTICTGILVAAYAGITKDKTATAPRFLIPSLRKQFSDTKLWDDSVRIVHDGNLWTSGRSTCQNATLRTNSI